MPTHSLNPRDGSHHAPVTTLMQSNWRLAVAAFRATFLTRTPMTYAWQPGSGGAPDRHWIDEVPVSEAVYELATGRKDLERARDLWLRDTHDAWHAA